MKIPIRIRILGSMLSAFTAVLYGCASTAPANLEALTLRSKVYTAAPVTLTRGEFRAPAAAGSASAVTVKLSDKRAFGTLDGKQAGAVIVTTSLGGTGTFYELALLGQADKDWVNTDSVLLGDRVNLHSVAIEKGQIVVAMTTHGPKDPMCCPTVEATKRWSVRNDRLVAVAGATPGQPSLTGTTWQWVQTLYNDDKRTAPARPENYTVQFEEGGGINVRADCNMKGGTYAVDGKRLSIELKISTIAACEPGSLKGPFVRDLTAGAIHFFRDGDLYIDLKYDSGTMRFRAQR
ncbi:MAG TPA: META domain-containing protein [Burkholderiales bacterium]|nr:META domain-containing protein [Burkholderiales bacterium]